MYPKQTLITEVIKAIARKRLPNWVTTPTDHEDSYWFLTRFVNRYETKKYQILKAEDNEQHQ